MLRTSRFTSATRAAVIAMLTVGSLAALASCSKTDTTTAPSSTTTTTAGPLTKEQFVAQANAVCTPLKAEAAKIDQELKAKHPDPNAVPEAEFQAIVRESAGRLLPLWKKEVADLKLLTPPAADAAMVNAGIAQLDAGAAAIEADPDAIVRGGQAQYQPGVDYGLTECFTPSTFQKVDSAVE